MSNQNNIHFISAPCHQSTRAQGFQFAPTEIKEQYDFPIDKEYFNGSVIDIPNKKIELCQGYELLYQYILKYSKVNQNDKIVTIGGDNSITTGTVSAMNEKYMKQMGEICKSDLMVLWIDANPDLFDFNSSINKNLDEMAAASLVGLCETYFVKNKLPVDINQLIYYGLVDDKDNLELVKELRIPHFTNKKINSINIKDIIDSVKSMIGNKPLHVVLDMKVFHNMIVKSVFPENPDGLELNKVTKVLEAVKENIVALDIVEFNPMIGNRKDVEATKDIIKYLLKIIFDIKEKRINLFSEYTPFLIYRPIEQIDYETDIGWYILRGMNFQQREELINLIPDDSIITLDIDLNDNGIEETFLITKTTINEQDEKSYFAASTIEDTTLFPQEKAFMCFELINS